MTVRAKAFLQTLVFLILVGIALFGAAGRFEFAEFWIYIAIIATISAVSLAILDADLIAERMRPGGKRVGRRFLPVIAILLVHWVLAGLDRGRLHLHDEVPLPLRISGLIGFAAGWALFVWAMQVNRYFSSIPRIQAERGHRVVAEGPYHWVRHPGYAGALLADRVQPASARVLVVSLPRPCRRCALGLAHCRRGAAPDPRASRLHRIRGTGALPPHSRPVVSGGRR
jgi:protein-S-isoprenylcysteine O-methyltransferase Ste14